MKINVGSMNQTKIQAVIDGVKLYPEIFRDAEVGGVEVKIEEFGHPKNLQEIVDGAIDRAKQAFKECNYSFGIESGLFAVPRSQSGYMELQACAIYDGKKIYLGLAPAFEWPTKVTELLLGGTMDASKAFKELGFTEHEKLGAVKGGNINLLTRGRLTREEQVKQSIIMAMIQIDRAEWYI
jgi:inosine/xanthosine triphosphatase